MKMKVSDKTLKTFFIIALLLTFLINGYLMIKPKAQISDAQTTAIVVNTSNTVVQTKNVADQLKALKKYREELNEVLKNADLITKYKIYSNLYSQAKAIVCSLQNLEVKMSTALNKSRFYSVCGYNQLDELKNNIDAVIDFIDLVKSNINMTPKERMELTSEAKKNLDETKEKIEKTIFLINEDNLYTTERNIKLRNFKY